jgi:hypothetical protein
MMNPLGVKVVQSLAAVLLSSIISVATQASTIPFVDNTAAVKSLPPAVSTAIVRLGSNTPGDGGSGVYHWSPIACTLQAGAGDDGREISPTAGVGCWLLDKQPSYDVRQWGVAATNPIHLTVVQATLSDTDLCGIVAAVPCKTIAGAQKTANQLNVMGNVVQIDLPAGTFTECISQNHPLLGAANGRPNPFSADVNLGPSFLLVKGVGPTTIWDGCSSYYYTYQASNGGAIGIKDLQIRSTGIPGAQLSFAVQQGGQAFSLGGITWGATSNVHVWAQDTGSLIVVAGADSITAGGNSFLYSAGGASIQVLGGALPWTAAISPGLTFASFYDANDGGQIIDGATAGHSFGNSITGSPLKVGGSGLFLNLSGMAYGTLLPVGTQIAIEYSAGRILPEPPTSVAVPSTGCGSACTTALTSYGPRSGYVTLTPGGTGITSSGGLNLSLGVALFSSFYSPCMATLNPSGTGTWIGGSAAAIGTPALVSNKETFTISWQNNGTNLTSGLTYIINYICAD